MSSHYIDLSRHGRRVWLVTFSTLTLDLLLIAMLVV